MNSILLSVIVGLATGALMTTITRIMFQDRVDNLKVGWWYFKNRPFSIGEEVRIIENQNIIEGVVEDVAWLSIIVKTDKNSLLEIPNSTWRQLTFVNLSRGGEIVNKENTYIITLKKQPIKEVTHE